MKTATYRKKTCTKCHRYLWLKDFYKMNDRKNYPDGYDCRCKECRRKEKNEEYARKRKVPDGIRINGQGIAVEHKGCSTRIYWGEEKIKDFRRKYPFERNEDLAIDFECSPRTVARRARELGLEKDPDWLHGLWDHNRKMAHRINRICGNKADLTNFINGGIPYRFKKKGTI